MAWYQASHDYNFGKAIDSRGPYLKPDINFSTGSGVPVIVPPSMGGTVTGVRIQPWDTGAWSITIKFDSPPNSVATHWAVNYIENPTVKVGQHVNPGDHLATTGNPYGIGTALAFTDASVYGQATKNDPFNRSFISPELNPSPFIDQVAKGKVPTTTPGSNGQPKTQPIILRAFVDSVLSDLRGDFNSPQEVVNFMISWCHHEGGSVTNKCSFNCLNTMQDESGAKQCPNTLPGIKAYPDGSTGIKATVDALKNGNYPSLLNALSTGDLINLGFTRRGSPSFANEMAGNVAGDMAVWLSGSRNLTNQAQQYIIAIMQGAGISNASIQGGTISGGNGTSQSVIDGWGNAVIGQDTTGVTVGGTIQNVQNDLAGALSGVNNFFTMISGFFSNPMRIVKIVLGVILLIIGLVLLVKEFTPSIAKVVS